MDRKNENLRTAAENYAGEIIGHPYTNDQVDETHKLIDAFEAGVKWMTGELPEGVNDLELATRSLIKYLNENYHLHAIAVVSTDRAEIFEGLKSTRVIEDYLDN